MSSRHHRGAVIAAVLAIVSAATLVAACAEDPERAPFVSEPAEDAQASLPDAARADGGAEPDAKMPFDPADEPVTCAGSPCVVQLVAGSDHFCARLVDGTVRCWGRDEGGALGAAADGGAADGGTSEAGAPVRAVAGLAGVTQLSAAGATTCALGADGRVLCWGSNVHGQLGLAVSPAIADEDAHRVPKPVALPGKAVRVDVGPTSACAVLEGGAVWCWGSDDQLQLARPDGGTELTYGLVRGPGLAGTGALSVARTTASTSSTFALTASGEVWSWGASGTGEGLVSGRVSSIANAPEPKRVEGLASVTSLAASAWFVPDQVFPPGGIGIPSAPPQPVAHACALAGGQVLCWGRSQRGALCTGLPDREITPRDAPVTSKAWPQQLSVAQEITCARLTDGTVQCCGEDGRGRLGTGLPLLYSAYFTPAGGFLGHAIQVAAGDEAVCALAQGGTVECWGSNEHGELGLGHADTLDHRLATPVAF
ncbi:MAG: hypothetical protein JWP97_5226 [Labilithrix sp.]|nr:hypothetical protein [Labilithrix sp.]